ncbi:MAG TPA: flagellar export protein FliJ [Solirubrobacteraceae bacterium]|jgi:flagellar export protein FliJ
MTGSPFRFRLERVRALRERKEDLAKQELALALGRLSDSEGALHAASERLAQAQQERRSATTAADTFSGADLRAGQAFLERVEHQRSTGVEALKRSELEVVDRGAALSKAAQEHQMLERLKQRQRDEHMRELARREGAMLDEIAIDRFRRSTA